MAKRYIKQHYLNEFPAAEEAFNWSKVVVLVTPRRVFSAKTLRSRHGDVAFYDL
jgi:hypothetical protein